MNGYKYNFQKEKCEKCYYHLGKCVEKCPEVSFVNLDNFTCGSKTYE